MSIDRERESRRRRRRSGGPGLSRAFGRLSASARNAVEVMRLGRLGAPYAAAFEVAYEDRVSKLRHYLAPAPVPGIGGELPDDTESLRPLLLVPPLMVTSEVYDISPELSAVTQLGRAGLDVWLVDFGAPERTPGGMERTLDDHVRAVDRAIDEVIKRTGKDVHLAGYSQGGMFCYQVAALRRSAGIRSILTFGSPVDIRRNLPGIGVQAAERVIAAARRAVEIPLRQMEGLPGFLTSTGFKLLSVRKEVQQVFEFVQKLHDRNALEKRESRRRFLAGEGFVAWPGPAFRTFVDEFIVHNRLASGGFVIDGRTVTLADVTCPILFFVGETDEIARAASVRAIREAAPAAEIHEIPVRAGHFGLVVGSRAVTVTWPSVIEWVRWRDANGAIPERLRDEPSRPSPIDIDDEEFDEAPIDVEAFYDVATGAVDAMWTRVSDVGREVGEVIDSLRWQVPRLQKLRRIEAHTRISMGKALADQAAAIPESTFFLWKGRAFTYRDADRRVDNVVRGLVHCGVRKGTRVGVLMTTRPSYLSIVCALNRMGAVAVLLSPDSTRISLEHALRLLGETGAPMELLVTDPDHAARAREAFTGPVLSLGGFGEKPTLPEGVLDMESIDPDAVVLPPWYEPDAGRASDLACIIFTAGRHEVPKAARITNRRWAFSALGAAAGCTLTSNDTVYCCLPLHHAAGMLVAVGGALVGGARLALAKRFDPETMWPEVRRYGATVVFYAGDMLRAVVEAPASPLDAHSPVRLFAGSGMRADVWERLVQRFGRASVLEFYGSTEGNAVLANASGTKIGALGRPLPGSTDLALLGWDFEKEDIARDESGRLLTSGVDEPGVLIARIDPVHPMASFDGYVARPEPRREGDEESEAAGRVLRGVFEAGDAWFVTGDLLRRDADGDYWFVDRLADVVRSPGGSIPTIAIEDSLARMPGVRRAAAYGVSLPGIAGEVLVASLVPSPGVDLDADTLSREIALALVPARRPRFVRLVDAIPLTDGYRTMKAPLREAGVSMDDRAGTFVYDATTERYAPLDAQRWEHVTAELRNKGGSKRPAARRR
ncbi:AMP-binding protein [Sandaracinus amylolyticus]|uniref:AMP-binding protein n=1 Tax=Sandaracinus amylolyticus TaxID=927083 RepID=UPI001F1F12E6|nr:AMP-binding protein [Sandaracinus amylolyticus]